MTYPKPGLESNAAWQILTTVLAPGTSLVRIRRLHFVFESDISKRFGPIELTTSGGSVLTLTDNYVNILGVQPAQLEGPTVGESGLPDYGDWFLFDVSTCRCYRSLLRRGVQKLQAIAYKGQPSLAGVRIVFGENVCADCLARCDEFDVFISHDRDELAKSPVQSEPGFVVRDSW